MNKVELESRMECMTDEVNFLRQLYDEVDSGLNWVKSSIFFLKCILFEEMDRPRSVVSGSDDKTGIYGPFLHIETAQTGHCS